MANPFTPYPDDGPIEILRSVLGPVVDSLVSGAAPAVAGGEASNMLGEAFRFLNSGVLFFGTIILLYVSVFSVVNTVNDGKVFGEKWSTFYTPLRTIGSAAALILLFYHPAGAHPAIGGTISQKLCSESTCHVGSTTAAS